MRVENELQEKVGIPSGFIQDHPGKYTNMQEVFMPFFSSARPGFCVEISFKCMYSYLTINSKTI